jgi:predicted nucleotidyltransferase component of viral defense system
MRFLECFSDSGLISQFYLSGGTALCGFYIPYRMSEDLDFFSTNEFIIQDITTWLKTQKRILKYNSYDMQTSFNRNLIFLEFDHETLKTEFTYYPFQTKRHGKYLNVTIDSLEDIAMNKLFTIYQKPRLRDFMDLFMILQEEGLDFNELRINTKTKFDLDIDVIQLGSQLLKVGEIKDKPTLVKNFNYEEMEKCYKDIAFSFKNTVLK